MRTGTLLGVVLMLCCLGSTVGAEPTPEFGEREKTFVDRMAAKDLAEIELSKAIKGKSSSAAVRRLARAILADDSANYEQLFKLCLRRHYAIAPQLDERHRRLLAEIRAARSSRALGRKYVDTLLLEEDRIAPELTRLAADKGLPQDLEQFASNSAQMIARHERMVRELASK